MSENTVAAANSPEAIQSAIVGYQNQAKQLTENLQELERQYATQKDNMTSTLKMLVGAIAALEQVIKNIEQEELLKTAGSKPAPDTTDLVVTEPQPA